MDLIMLVESQHKPIPNNITVVQEFGSECIVNDDGKRIRGTSMVVSGEPESFVDWLKPFDGVWITNSPLSGNWFVVHVPVGEASEV